MRTIGFIPSTQPNLTILVVELRFCNACISLKIMRVPHLASAYEAVVYLFIYLFSLFYLKVTRVTLLDTIA